MKIKNLIIAALFIALTAICAQIVIPAPYAPFNLSILAIMLAGGLQKPKFAFLSILAYIALGAFGLPIFSGAHGGLQTLTSPTGGYLISFPIIALTISLFYSKTSKPLPKITALIISILICHTLGVIWLHKFTALTLPSAFMMGSAKFLIFDALKGILAYLLIEKIAPHLKPQSPS